MHGGKWAKTLVLSCVSCILLLELFSDWGFLGGIRCPNWRISTEIRELCALLGPTILFCFTFSSHGAVDATTRDTEVPPADAKERQ